MLQQDLFPEIERRPSPPLKDRLLFAFYPDSETATSIAQCARELAAENELKGRPLSSSRLHITVNHLGDYAGLPQAVVDGAVVAATGLAAAPFGVLFDRVESFKGRPGNRPLVLRGGEGLASLMNFQSALCNALNAAGLGRLADRNFTPHVTLLYDAKGVEAHPVGPFRWNVRELVLVHSLLGQTRHVALGRWPLAA